MENASKALLMAGSVLISLLVIGALLLMFNNLSSYQESNIQNTREAQVIEFNNQFANYNRENVRGNELYSLLNKVIDYNKRKTIEGDEGAIEIGYKPMTIEFSLKSKDGSKNRMNFTIDNNVRLFRSGNDYTVGKSTNTFEDYIVEELGDIESTYGKDVLTKLTTGFTRIFVDNPDDNEKSQLVKSFNDISTKVEITSFDEIRVDSTIRNDVSKYYEYVQFKRAYFDCVKCEYDKDTGRITYMEFKFNGSFQ